MTVVLAKAEPPGPVAVIVYVVVSAGKTPIDPLGSTLPTPGSMSQESAPVEFQERVVDAPGWIVSGSAATERLGGSASGVAGVALSLSPQDVTMKRLVNKRKLIKTRFFMILPPVPTLPADYSSVTTFWLSPLAEKSMCIMGNCYIRLRCRYF